MGRMIAVGLLAVLGIVGSLPAAAADFDARRPGDVLSVVTTNGASGALKTAKDGKPYIDAKAGKIFFDIDFYDCDDAKALCATQNFYASWTSKDVTVAQMNRWNQWTLWCPGYLDKDGAPNMWSNAPVYARETREDVVGTVDQWLGCLRDFDEFVANPEDVLKRKEAPAKP
ncbi:MAG TPA: hypothetical protein VF459_20630 [Caulobacteraceae bacterium]